MRITQTGAWRRRGVGRTGRDAEAGLVVGGAGCIWEGPDCAGAVDGVCQFVICSRFSLR